MSNTQKKQSVVTRSFLIVAIVIGCCLAFAILIRNRQIEPGGLATGEREEKNVDHTIPIHDDVFAMVEGIFPEGRDNTDLYINKRFAKTPVGLSVEEETAIEIIFLHDGNPESQNSLVYFVTTSREREEWTEEFDDEERGSRETGPSEIMITDRQLVFPDATSIDNGGSLEPGDAVLLRNGEGEERIFLPGEQIHFALVPDEWSDYGDEEWEASESRIPSLEPEENAHTQTYTTLDYINPEHGADQEDAARHVVFTQIAGMEEFIDNQDFILMSIEDENVTTGDRDFNDFVAIVKTDPPNVLNLTSTVPLDSVVYKPGPDFYGVWGSTTGVLYAAGQYSTVKGGLFHYNYSASKWVDVSPYSLSPQDCVFVDSYANHIWYGGGGLHYYGSWCYPNWCTLFGSGGHYGIWGPSAENVFISCENCWIEHFDRAYGQFNSDTFQYQKHPVTGIGVWSHLSYMCFPELRDVWGSSGYDVFIVGDAGRNRGPMLPDGTPDREHAIILHYDGNSWLPMVSNSRYNLSGVWGSSGKDVFAVGWYGTIVHYDGNSWSKMTSPTSESLYGIWGSSEKDIYAVGENGTIIHYDGSSWTPVTSPTSYTLMDIWGSSSTKMYAVGANRTILHYDGSSWSLMTVEVK